ncbi:MAG: hypothetical protein JJU03_12690 [Idiomarina sp.]|nr:hypothetical protein [Idiomarina sp.]
MFRFILIHGVLTVGVSGALLSQLIIHMTGNGSSTFGIVDSLVVFSFSGAVWGFFMWRERELNRKFPKRKTSNRKIFGIK